MRSKEDAHDYRYFPDPDLLPLKLEQKLIDDLKKSLPELPDNKKERLFKNMDLTHTKQTYWFPKKKSLIIMRKLQNYLTKNQQLHG